MSMKKKTEAMKQKYREAVIDSFPTIDLKANHEFCRKVFEYHDAVFADKYLKHEKETETS